MVELVFCFMLDTWLKQCQNHFCEFVSKLFEKLSIYISFFIIFFNIFQVTFIKLHSQTHKIEKTG